MMYEPRKPLIMSPRYTEPRRMLYEASPRRSIEWLSPSLRATAEAVAGISCIMPRAPTPERAAGSKLLSWREIE